MSFENSPHIFPFIASDPRSRAPRCALLRSYRHDALRLILFSSRGASSDQKRLGVWGRDALRKHHSAVFLAKARAGAMLQAIATPTFSGSPRNIFLGVTCGYFSSKDKCQHAKRSSRGVLPQGNQATACISRGVPYIIKPQGVGYTRQCHDAIRGVAFDDIFIHPSQALRFG